MKMGNVLCVHVGAKIHGKRHSCGAGDWVRCIPASYFVSVLFGVPSRSGGSVRSHTYVMLINGNSRE